MAIDTGRTEPRSRRAILAGAIGGVAGLIGSRFVNPDRTSAAAGDPVIMGAANSAGTTNTSLATSSAGTALLVTQNGTGTALRGSAVGAGSIAGFFTANNGTGISGVTGNGGSYGVFAQNNGAAGSAGALRASGGQNHGVVATTANVVANAVLATNSGSGVAIQGNSTGDLTVGDGVKGTTSHESGSGVVGVATASAGIVGQPASGVYGFSYTPLGYGVWGESNQADGEGVHGRTTATTGNGYGVRGISDSDGTGGPGIGVYGTSNSGLGVKGDTTTASGVVGNSTNFAGLYGSGGAYAAYLAGNVQVTGALAVTGAITAGTKDFKIDHPLDPAQKYLSHSCVESPDMMNVYNGIATLDAKGEATVSLPQYFDALNRDFRYQLTAIGKAAPDLHVKTEAKNNSFSIGGGANGQRVSWQISGIRQDAYAKAHPIVVEAAKVGAEKGKYLHPVENGVAKSKGFKLSPTGAKG